MIVLIIVFDFFVMIAMIGFMFHTLRNIRLSLHLMDDPIYLRIRNQTKFRRCQLLVCHTFISVFYLF